MTRIESPPIKRAKIRRARLCSSVEERTGLGAAGGTWVPFGEIANIENFMN